MSIRLERSVVWIVVLALVLYLPGVWWGAPHATGPDRIKAWAVDDETPLGPLAELSNIAHPREDRNLGYPLLYSFLASAVYLPYLGYLYLTGRFRAPSGDYPFGLDDPVGTLWVLTVLAHLLTVLLSLGVILGAYRAAQAYWDRRTAIWSALFVMTAYPMFYYARTGNVDVPMLSFLAVGYAILALILAQGVTTRRIALLGFAVGLALATKESALGVVIGMAIAALAAPRADGLARNDWRNARWWRTWGAGILAALVALGAGSGFFIEPSRYIAHLAFLTGRVEAAPGAGGTIPLAFPLTMQGHLEYLGQIVAYLIDILTLPGLILAAVGLADALRRRPREGLLALPGLTYLIFIFITLRTGQMRYLLPAAFVLAIFAGRAVARGWSARLPAVRAVTVATALVAIGLSVLRGVDLSYAMLRDSRWAAASWLANRMPNGGRVEYFGASQKLPPLAANVTSARTADYRGLFFAHDTSEAKVAEIVASWETNHPDFILVMPDHTSRPGLEYDASVPPGLYRALLSGSLPYHLAATFQTPPLFSWVRRPELDYPMVNPPIRIFAPAPVQVRGTN